MSAVAVSSVEGRATRGGPLRLALVCWSGNVGGAEVFSADLAVALREQGAEPGVVVVGADGPISDRLDATSVPRVTLGLARGSRVLVHPRRLARAVTDAGRDGAILQSDGYLAAALRAGGYRGRIVAVQHGAVLLRSWLPAWRRVLREVDQLSGVPALDALVVVSDSARLTASRHPHPRRMLTIHNGVDLERFRTRPAEAQGGGLVVGFAGRLIEGKGTEVLLHALARIRDDSLRAEIAGEGPARDALESLANRLGIAPRVHFRGPVNDMAAFWQTCDLAVVPSHPPHVESFGIVAIEAMASGLPVVATANGALPELVTHGRSGTIVPEGDPDALAAALDTYAAHPYLRVEEGRQGRADCERWFGIGRCAQAYLELFESLGTGEEPTAA
jgi:glycosyltransferase involved in cell wall biosynthesis